MPTQELQRAKQIARQLFPLTTPTSKAFTLKRKSDEEQIAEINAIWEEQKKDGTYRKRNYTAADVVRLRNPNQNPLNTQSQIAAQFRDAIERMDTHSTEHFKALGAYDPWDALNTSLALRQAQEEARAEGRPEPQGAIYLSGWMIAALANDWGLLPDQSMHPKNAVPALVRRMNQFFDQYDKFAKARGMLKPNETSRLPIIVDIDAGFGNETAAFILTEEAIDAGAAAVHVEDQNPGAKKCGHMGGKVVDPISNHIAKLNAIRLAADTKGLHKFTIISRTDRLDAALLDKISDPRDYDRLQGTYHKDTTTIPKNAIMIHQGDKGIFVPDVTEDGYFRLKTDDESSRQSVAKIHIICADYADLLWTETKTANLQELADINRRVLEVHPKQKFAYNNSPSFNWDLNFRKEVLRAWQNANDPRAKHYDVKKLEQLPANDPLVLEADKFVADFQPEAAKLGVKFNFVTLGGFHKAALAAHLLTKQYNTPGVGMLAYSKGIQRKEREHNIQALRHQEMVGAAFYDDVATTIKGGVHSTSAMHGSTEEAQFAPTPLRSKM